MNQLAETYADRRVLVTGHTGFKGAWLSQWLDHLGASVSGYSDGTPTDPSAFDLLGLDRRLDHHVGDIRDRRRLADVIDEVRPEMVFHLAAQPLVLRSIADPVETFEVNTMGMVNILECIRDLMNADAPVPDWLHDVFLGYGDPAAAQGANMPREQRLATVDLTKPCTVSSECGRLSTRDGSVCSDASGSGTTSLPNEAAPSASLVAAGNFAQCAHARQIIGTDGSLRVRRAAATPTAE